MSPEATIHRFGPFTLDVGNRQLLRDGVELTVRARAFDVLVVLVERAGRLVTKDELLDAVWSELAVEENNLQVQVSSLRKLLGPGWIATVPGRGYRFSGEASAITPAPAAPARAAHAAPEPTSPLIGRDAEVAAVLESLAAARLVTIVGPGGIGKTRLALEVARVASGAADRCAWIDLTAIPDPSLTREGIAAALSVPAVAGEALDEALVDALRAKATLVVFDNAEHVLEALAPLVARILARAPGLRVLVTSQAPCRVSGEHVHRLSALALPEEGATASAAAASGAVALFVARARALVGDAFKLDEANVASVVSLCRRLDGVPLALELAAGRLPALGLETLVRRLEHRFRLLTAGDRSAPARQRTLEALFDWSHGLLGADEQTVFRRLGLLASTFTLEQAIAVASNGALDEWAVVEILGDLVDRSLVVSSAGDPPVYALSETGRAYARSRIDVRADRASIDRAIRLYQELGTAAAARSENAEALHACSAALDLVSLLAPGRERDGRELELCLALGPVIQSSIGPAHPRAEAVYRRASQIAAALPPGEQGFMALWGLWQFLSMTGRDREAAEHSDAIVRLASQLGDPALELEAWHARMTTAQLLGRAAEVVANAERVLALYDRERHHALAFRFGGHDPGVCALGQGAVGLWLIGRPDDAADQAARAQALGATMDHAYSRAVAQFYPAFTWCLLGDREAFRRATVELSALCDRHAMDMLSNEALLLGGRARWEAGDAIAGIADMERALDTIDAGGDYAFALFYASLLTEALFAAGRTDDAARRIVRAGEYARAGQRFFLADVTRWDAELHARRGDAERASQLFERACTLALEDGAVALALRAAVGAAEAADARGRAPARERVRSLLERVRGGATTADIGRARQALAGPERPAVVPAPRARGARRKRNSG